MCFQRHIEASFGLLFRQSVIVVVALVQLESGVAIVAALNGVTFGLSGLNTIGTEYRSQFLFDNIGLDLAIFDETCLLQETVGETLHLAVGVLKIAITQSKPLFLGDTFLLNAGSGILTYFVLLLFSQIWSLYGKGKIEVKEICVRLLKDYGQLTPADTRATQARRTMRYFMVLRWIWLGWVCKSYCQLDSRKIRFYMILLSEL